MNDRIVIKIGGSLLAEPGVMRPIADWLTDTAQPGQSRLLVAGGGGPVEGLRRIDVANPLAPETAHWAAVEIMDAHAALLADWLPAVRVTDRAEAVAGDWSVRCGRFLREVEHSAPGEKLRIGWKTTSDAIAARLAVCLEADLLIVKHTLKKTYGSLADAATDGVIDPETPRIGASLASIRLLGAVAPGLPLGGG